jgi:hypothetical protein
VDSASRSPQIDRRLRPNPGAGLSGVDEFWAESGSDGGLGTGGATDPRTKRLRFFNVDNSNLRRARVFLGLEIFRITASRKIYASAVFVDEKRRYDPMLRLHLYEESLSLLL